MQEKRTRPERSQDQHCKHTENDRLQWAAKEKKEHALEVVVVIVVI